MRFRRTGIILGITVFLASCVQDTPSVVEPPVSADQGTAGTPPGNNLAPLIFADRGRGLSDEYIVKLRDEVVPRGGVQAVAIAALGPGAQHLHRTWDTFRGFHATIPREVVDQMTSHPAVEYIEQNQRVLPANAVPDAALPVPFAPVPDSGTQASPPWHLDRIDQADYPLDNEFSYAYSGDGVTIYVIDSGIRTTHSDFGNRASHVYQADDNWVPAGADCLWPRHRGRVCRRRKPMGRGQGRQPGRHPHQRL